jgi:hypothetical protein
MPIVGFLALKLDDSSQMAILGSPGHRMAGMRSSKMPHQPLSWITQPTIKCFVFGRSSIDKQKQGVIGRFSARL